MHCLAVYVKKGLLLAQSTGVISRKICRFLCIRLALLHSRSYFFFHYCSLTSSSGTGFYSISSNIDEILLINPSANGFVFGDFNIIHKDWLIYSCETDRPGELCHNFFISQMTLLRQLIFLMGSLTVTFSYALLDLFFSSDASICSTVAFPPSRNSLHVFVSVSIDFTSNSKQDATLHHIADDYSRAD